MFQEGALVLSQKEQQLSCNPMSNSKNGLRVICVQYSAESKTPK